ncbi:hypothetical protein ACEOET_003612 [Escherichia coli]
MNKIVLSISASIAILCSNMSVFAFVERNTSLIRPNVFQEGKLNDYKGTVYVKGVLRASPCKILKNEISKESIEKRYSAGYFFELELNSCYLIDPTIHQDISGSESNKIKYALKYGMKKCFLGNIINQEGFLNVRNGNGTFLINLPKDYIISKNSDKIIPLINLQLIYD